MCQLTLINIDHEKAIPFSQIILSNQLITNSRKSNRDGYGFFADRVFKFHIAPDLTTNLGEMIKSYATGKTILAHVRQATFTNGVKVIDPKNSHPFESKDFILAHNGTLVAENYKLMREPRFNGMIDSQIFLTVLQENYNKSNKSKDILSLLNETMNLFKGKFAFLIYFKRNKKFYVVRGLTADLYVSDIFITERNDNSGGTRIGFIVNTDKADLANAFDFSEPIIYLALDSRLYINEPILLESESVFEVNGLSLVKLGKLIEKSNVVYTYQSSKDVIPISSNKSAILKFIDDYGLSIIEFDELVTSAVGLGLIDINKNNESVLIEQLEPIAKKFYNQQKHSLWKKIRSKYPTNDVGEIYVKNNLQFPYMMNSVKELEEVWIEVRSYD